MCIDAFDNHWINSSVCISAWARKLFGFQVKKKKKERKKERQKEKKRSQRCWRRWEKQTARQAIKEESTDRPPGKEEDSATHPSPLDRCVFEQLLRVNAICRVVGYHSNGS
ncbi:hypothetical protein CHARACLAT_000741 [Characodon lateralis]|uniref:Uncharacterized protein n=1 Tax=Characodon lateralis TaxID=208331 RepID=A0ABU7D326_9TELE|nr:hypothetical protein [Characodon lateralis]